LILLQEMLSDVPTHSRSSSAQNMRESSRDKHISGGQKSYIFSVITIEEMLPHCKNVDEKFVFSLVWFSGQ
jgi:hypothetical protein